MKKDYYIFTDSKEIYGKRNDNIHIIPQRNLGWPGITLYRYHIILTQKEELQNYKYIFFLNANTIIQKRIGEEFLPKDEGLLFVNHCGFVNEPNYKFTYERNPNSTAYIPMKEGKYYVVGGLNGGRTNDYLNMYEILKKRVDEDDKKDIVAVWHDESHLNRYLLDLDENNYKLLNISYGFSEYCSHKIKNIHPKVLFIDKSKYINIRRIKGKQKQIMGNNRKRNMKKVKRMIRKRLPIFYS